MPIFSRLENHIMPRCNEDRILTIGLFDFLLREDSLNFNTDPLEKQEPRKVDARTTID